MIKNNETGQFSLQQNEFVPWLPMQIDIITLFPAIFDGPFDQSIMKRAKDREQVAIHLHQLRDFATNKHRQVDDYAFGGGAGMVMMCEPIDLCLSHVNPNQQADEIIYLSPDGELFDQKIANELSLKKHLIFLCGHYKGVDERVREKMVTRELSIGNYVLTGGELAAAVIVDAIVRLIPGVLGDEGSALSDSFQDDLISPPVYTRPADYKGMMVPEILLSGHQAKIDEWRHEQSLLRTQQRRPDLLK